MPDKLNTYLDKHEKQLCRFLRSLIRVPTVNPPGENYAECVALFEDKLKSLGLKTKIVRVPDARVRKSFPECGGYPRDNLVARWDVGAKETVHFNGHYDVVPASGKWRFGPFEPKIADGWLYGRGSADMKGPNACLCFALEALQKCGITPKMNVEVSFTCDEETGGELGAGYVVEKGLAKADYAVVLEGSSGKQVGLGHNGILWFDVKVKGKAAHASSPEKGVNAFEKMCELTGELQWLKEENQTRSFSTAGSKEMHPTISLGGVFGVGPGAKVNTVPAEASFTIDRRVIPSEKLPAVKREVLSAIRAAGHKVPGLKTEVSTTLALAPCVIGHLEPLPQAFAEAIRKVRGGRPKFGTTPGFTDLHYFVEDGKMRGIGYGTGGKGVHGIDERVKVSDLVATAKVYASFLAG